MSVILATTGSNALRHASTGLGVVRYWSYTKHPLGETWEADFPATIYLVGCHPPYAVMIWCTASPTEKVLYHSNESCSTTDPGGQYVISWDRRAYCPWGASEVCPGGGGIEKATLDLCLTVNSVSLINSKWIRQPSTGVLYSCSGCVDLKWRWARIGGVIVCVQYGYEIQLLACSASSGVMTGNSTDGWTRGSIYISPAGVVSFGCFSIASGPNWFYPYWVTFGVGYGGTGSNISLDDDFNCPVGPSTIPVLATNYTDASNQPWGGPCCPDGTMCEGHAYNCNAGTITITTSVKIGGSC